MPAVDLGKVVGDKGTSMRNRGEWNATSQYVNNAQYIDMVSHNGNLWTCLVTNTNVEPAENKAQWNLSAASVAAVYFSEAAKRENITSGEKVETAFGKIAKWFSDLKDSAFKNVANNLTTTADGSVLDARQGKVLKDNRIVTLDEIDLVTEEGFFVDAMVVKSLNSKLIVTESDIKPFTPREGQNYTGWGGCYYYKAGNRVHIHLGIQGLAANTVYTVYILPSEARPKSGVRFVGLGGSFGHFCRLEVATDGGLNLTSQDGYAGCDVEYDVY